uniref:Uncharacterized protein n=1 Tax=Anopheles minimus TaxID=112268 RepID=A0A182VQU4_9DIPT
MVIKYSELKDRTRLGVLLSNRCFNSRTGTDGLEKVLAVDVSMQHSGAGIASSGNGSIRFVRKPWILLLEPWNGNVKGHGKGHEVSMSPKFRKVIELMSNQRCVHSDSNRKRRRTGSEDSGGDDDDDDDHHHPFYHDPLGDL